MRRAGHEATAGRAWLMRGKTRGGRAIAIRKIAIWSQRQQDDHFPQYDALACGGDVQRAWPGQPQIGDHEVPFRARIMASAILATTRFPDGPMRKLVDLVPGLR